MKSQKPLILVTPSSPFRPALLFLYVYWPMVLVIGTAVVAAVMPPPGGWMYSSFTSSPSAPMMLCEGDSIPTINTRSCWLSQDPSRRPP